MLQDLEAANAFAVSLDTSRTWFRYHQLFADLLRLQLRRTRPGEVVALHRAAADWLAGRGMEVEAIRHAQAARDWGWLPGCSPTSGPACTWTGRPPSSTGFSPDSPPSTARRTRSWRRWPRPTSWPAVRRRQRNGTCAWRSGRWRRRIDSGGRSCSWGSSGC
ncbi:hypothetical protein E4K10_04630 [Streptomyces sp. T1317-0309]|nr:hypothetical protein E4K10_04630 [Streptomyces sp. T1317-0309]